jgi:hypothetical protein
MTKSECNVEKETYLFYQIMRDYSLEISTVEIQEQYIRTK